MRCCTPPAHVRETLSRLLVTFVYTSQASCELRQCFWLSSCACRKLVDARTGVRLGSSAFSCSFVPLCPLLCVPCVSLTRSIPVSYLKGMLADDKDWTFDDFDLRATVGTGTFGRVRVVKIKGSTDRTPMALKIMKKSEVAS